MTAQNAATLVAVLEERAAQTPNATALVFVEDGEEVAVSYARLDARARAVAASLRDRFPPGARVVLVYPPGVTYVEAFFACLYAGLIAVPAYPPDPARLDRTAPRLASILEDAEAVALLTTEAIKSLAPIVVEQTPALGGPEWFSTDDVDDARGAAFKPSVTNGDDLAFLQYTSGSTGTPKGVMLSHANLLANVELIRGAFGLDKESRGVIWLPPYHDMGLIGGILAPIVTGFPVWLTSPLSFLHRPSSWVDLISRHQATHSGGPNFAYDLCARKVTEEELAVLDLSAWRLAFNGAEPIRSGTLERFAARFSSCGFSKRAFYPCYGLAESTLIVSGGRPGSGATVSAFQSDALENHWIADARIDHRVAVEVIGSRGESRRGQIVNISRNGLFIETGDPLPSGESLSVRFELLGEGFSCGARVAHERDADSASVPGVGLRLLHDSLEERRRYERLVLELVLSQPHEGPRPARVLVGCGGSLPGHEVVIVNPDTQRRAWPNQVGEIWVRGPSVARGYWGRDAESMGTFQAHLMDARDGPFLRTGDLGFLRDGELYVTGRLKDLLVIHGVNHYPQDIEETVERVHPSVRPGCVAAFSVEVEGAERVVVVAEIERRRLRPPDDEVVPSGEDRRRQEAQPALPPRPAATDIDELAREIRRSIAFEHELSPHEIVLIPPGSITKTSSGKVQRHACRLGYLSGALNVISTSVVGAGAPPREEGAPLGDNADEEAVRALIEIFEETLGLADISPQDSFLSLGGDSVSAGQVAARVRERFDVDLPLRTVFESPTPVDLALEVESLILDQLEDEAAGDDP